MVVSLAAVRALAEFEYLNATFAGDELTLHRSVNLGVMRAVDEDGMLVPVVHAAAGLTLRALARRVSELDERLASRQLTTDDLMGGTFTVVGAPERAHALERTHHHPTRGRRASAWARCARCRSSSMRDGRSSVEVGRRLVLGSRSTTGSVSPGAASYLERVGELLAGMDLESER